MTMTLFDILATAGITAFLTLAGIGATKRIAKRNTQRYHRKIDEQTDTLLRALDQPEQVASEATPDILTLSLLALAIAGRSEAIDTLRTMVMRTIEARGSPEEGASDDVGDTVSELVRFADYLLYYRDVVESAGPTRITTFEEYQRIRMGDYSQPVPKNHK